MFDKVEAEYARYEQAWRDHVDRVNSERFGGGMFPARFTERDKQAFIQTLALIEMKVRAEDVVIGRE